MARPARRPRRDRPRPDHPGAHRRDHQDHLDQHLRLRPAPVRDARRRSWTPGDILGHEPMGIVEEVGSEVGDLKRRRPGRRSRSRSPAAHCWMCDQQLYTQCETTQVRDQGMGAALFGFSKLYGEVPGGQAEYLRVPQAQFTHIKVPDGPAGRRGSSTSPTSCRPRGRRWSTPTCPTAARSSCSGSARSATWPCRIAQHQGVPGHRRRPGARAARAGPRRAASRCVDLDEHEDDLGDVDPRPDRRPRPRLGDRRRRHGGARLAGRQVRPAGRPGCCPTRSPSR